MGHRIKAMLTGERHYFTGKLCRHGHTSIRITASARCVECERVHDPKHYGDGRGPQRYTSKRLIALGMAWSAQPQQETRK